jgi:monofunctional glycosyltransferase
MRSSVRKPRKQKARRRGWIARILRGLLLLLLGGYLTCLAGMVMLKWIDPWFTMVHVQRRLEAIFEGTSYQRRYDFEPMSRISPHLQRAVIAAEDGRFYQHNGFDWKELQKVSQEFADDGRLRGASTLTQQLMKNLFLTTHSNALRKALEIPLVPPAEWILGKRRILELYLNVVEWGPGVYGAEAAARYHYGQSAAKLSREQAARLAATLPAPRRRKPARMHQYSAIIEERMRQSGW